MPQKLGHKTNIFHPKILGHHPIATPAKYNPTTIPPTKAILLTNLCFLTKVITGPLKSGFLGIFIPPIVEQRIVTEKQKSKHCPKSEIWS